MLFFLRGWHNENNFLKEGWFTPSTHFLVDCDATGDAADDPAVVVVEALAAAEKAVEENK